MNTPPLVSVVIPVYNVEKYVSQCIKSVLEQTYESLEIIVVNDASPDNSMALVSKFDDPRIKVVNQENRGLAGARNTGIREATGKYVALLDSDDFWQRNKIQKHVHQLESMQDIGVSFSASMFVNEDGNETGRLQKPLRSDGFTPQHIFCRNPIGNGSAPVIRKSIFDAICFQTDETVYDQYFNERMRQSEDIECWVRIALKTKCAFGYIDQPLTYYRLNGGGLSANVDKQLASWEYFVDQLNVYAPDFATQHAALARAYQYRYLARRLILEGSTLRATRLMVKAINSHLGILWFEPTRSWTTLVACLVLSLIPKAPRMTLIQRFV